MKKASTMENKVNSSTDPTTVTNISTATTSTSTISTKQSSSASTTATKQSLTTTEPMDMSINLKRRRDSEDSPTKEGEKKHQKKTVQKTPPIPQPKGDKTIEKISVPNQRPAQLIPPPQKPKTTQSPQLKYHYPPLFHQLQPQKYLQGHIRRPDFHPLQKHRQHQQHQHHQQCIKQEHARLLRKPGVL